MSIRVLLVDAQTPIRRGIKAVLQPERDIHVIGEAGNGQEALGKAVTLQADLVLMDIALPGGDGISAIRAIKQCCPNAQILILTTYADAVLFRKAVEAGAIGYVLKDISPANLVNAIRAVRNGRTMLSPVIAKQMMDQMMNHSGGASGRRIHGLKEREIEVLIGVAQGLSDKEIAARLFLSEATVKTHLRAVYHKLGLRNRAQAAAFAVEKGLLGPRIPLTSR